MVEPVVSAVSLPPLQRTQEPALSGVEGTGHPNFRFGKVSQTLERACHPPDATNNYMMIAPVTDYNSAGQLKHFTYGNGVVADFGYNDHFETTSIRYSKTGSADLLNLVYNYGTQNDGEISTITDNLDATHSTSYTYDAWARLSTAQAGPNATPTWKYSYDYDRFGNRKNQNLLAGTTGYNTQLTIDPATNRITGTGNTYDAAGNMTGDSTHVYAFDAENGQTREGVWSAEPANCRQKTVPLVRGCMKPLRQTRWSGKVGKMHR